MKYLMAIVFAILGVATIHHHAAHHHVAPATVTITTVAPKAIHHSLTAPTTTTTTPVSEPAEGPQPVGPSQTVNVPSCLVTYSVTETDSNGIVSTQQRVFGGDCSEAQALADQYGGTVTEQTDSMVAG